MLNANLVYLGSGNGIGKGGCGGGDGASGEGGVRKGRFTDRSRGREGSVGSDWVKERRENHLGRKIS